MSATGWTNFGGQSKKWHFIDGDGYSLCRKWRVFTAHELAQGMDESPDNCAECRRKARAAIARVKGETA